VPFEHFFKGMKKCELGLSVYKYPGIDTNDPGGKRGMNLIARCDYRATKPSITGIRYSFSGQDIS